MTNANYDRFLKLLGKLCNAYDTSGSNVSTMQSQLYRTIEQASKSDQEFQDLPEVLVIAQNMTTWNNYINNGPAGIQSLMLSIAGSLFVNADFIAALTNTPANNTVTGVMAAWVADFTANSKTLTTLAATGLVNFLNKLWTANGGASTPGFPTSGSPSYADSVYVVTAII